MNKFLKISLWIGGLIITVPVGLILIGALSAIFGVSNTPASNQDPTPIEISAPEPKPVRSTPSVTDGIATTSSTKSTPGERLILPKNITAKDAMRWFVENRFVNSRGDTIYVDFEKFTYLSLEDALTLHTLFSKAQHTENIKHSTPETETLKRQYYMLHLYVTAGASEFSPEDRQAFAKKSGAVFPTSVFHNVTPRGDYANLFDWHKRDSSGSAEIAIRKYAEVFGDKEMIATLKKIGAIEISKTRTNSNYSSRWRISVGEKLAQFEPETLQAIHDSIKKTIGGDRVKLRRDLRKLIDSRHTAESSTSKD